MNRKIVIIAAIALIIVVSISGFLFFTRQQTNVTVTPSEFAIALQITYSDGTSKMFYPNRPVTTLAPLTITDTGSGATVSNIRIFLQATPTYGTGPGVSLSTWSCSGTSSGWIKSDSGTTLATVTSNADIGKSNQAGSGLPSGSASTIFDSGNVAYTTLLSYYGGWQGGTSYHYVWHISNFGMTLYFSDGQSLSKTATATDLDWRFTYQANGNSFSSLTVSWGINPT